MVQQSRSYERRLAQCRDDWDGLIRPIGSRLFHQNRLSETGIPMVQLNHYEGMLGILRGNTPTPAGIRVA